MEKKEILEMLKKFGLNEYESKAYTTLILSGSCRAGELSNLSSIPQSKIYETLESLMDKNLVEMFDGRPKEFKAIAPEVALPSLLERVETKIQVLKKEVKEISAFLKPIHPQEKVAGGIWTIKGRKYIEFFNRLADMLDRSEKYAYAITRDFSRTRRLTDAVKECVRRGVDLKIMGMNGVTDKNYYRAKWYDVHGIKIRVFKTDVHPRILVADGKEIFIRLDHAHDPLKKKFSFHSIWSEDPSLVKVIDSYMKNLWLISKPVDFRKIPAPAKDI